MYYYDTVTLTLVVQWNIVTALVYEIYFNLNALLEHVGLFVAPGHEMLLQYNQLMYELKCVIQKIYIKYVLWIVAIPHVGKVINELSANHNLLSY